MASGKHFEIAISILLILALVLPMPHAYAFTSNQTAAIVIGQSKDFSYALGWPAGGMAFDPSGNLWVADLQNSRVLEFLAPFSANMTPSIVLGQPDFQSWGSGWFANEMTYPSSVTFDRTGNLWVADTDNNRVTEFTPPFHNGMNASLVIGQRTREIPSPLPDWSSTVPATSRNGLAAPDGIVFDAYGDLWVADSWNGRVLGFQPPFSNNMNASLVVGERDFTTSCNQETRNDTLTLCGDSRTLNGPMAVAFDAAGNLWITDTINLGTYATPQYQGRMLEFTSPFRDGTKAALVIHVPAGSSSLAFDSNGNLWLGCAACMSNAAGYVSEYNSPFSASMTPSLIIAGNNTNPTAQTITNPTALSFDSAGNLWVVDSNRVLGFNTQIHSVLGSTGRVRFRNQGGLLAPLSSIPTLSVASMQFPVGLFNFTIQGLPPHGSVIVSITFPKPLPANIGWWSVVRGNPLGNGTLEFAQIPSNQTLADGNNMTLTLNNASGTGVVSVFGGPAYPVANLTSTSETSLSTLITTTTGGSLNANPLSTSVLVAVAMIVVVIAAVAIRKRGRHAAKGAGIVFI